MLQKPLKRTCSTLMFYAASLTGGICLILGLITYSLISAECSEVACSVEEQVAKSIVPVITTSIVLGFGGCCVIGAVRAFLQHRLAVGTLRATLVGSAAAYLCILFWPPVLAFQLMIALIQFAL